MKRSPAILIPTLLLAGLVLIQTASTASAQGLDDLFERPTDARFETLPTEEPQGPADEFKPASSFGEGRLQSSGPAVERIPFSDRSLAMLPVSSPSDLKLVDEHNGSKSRDPLRMTAMELRQARALEETRSRIARLEAARWAGSPTLRPSWNPNPTTASRFSNRNIMQVPIYIRTR
ncbi:malate synthase [Neorhodopirellula pilleata]|nr:malate synthase [Neorhodopirellula pilleata]